VTETRRERRGLVQVYTGEGKGKTTAALGLALRALGQGMRVLLVRLLKAEDPPSGEVLFLRQQPNIDLLSSGIGGVAPRDPEVLTASVVATFAKAQPLILSGKYDLVILDEVNNAVHRGALAKEALLELLSQRPSEVELVLTGRHAAPEVLALADLVTRMENVRHPMASGIAARRGVEF